MKDTHDSEQLDAFREDVVWRREQHAQAREEAAQLREQLASLREAALLAQEEAAQSRAALEARVMGQLREANQNLVIATVHAQTMTEAAELANRQKEQFLAMLAHELRNPLAPIVNALAVLRRVETPDPLLPWAHDVIKRQVGHMMRLLNDLLDVSRITSGKIALQKRPTAVLELMLNAIETSRPIIENRKQNLEVENPQEPLTVDGDPARLAQVFSNLLNNAAKYTHEGGAITLAAKRRGDDVVLSVTDDGIGIAAEALPTVFELFTQEDRSLAHAQGGLGIGLTVVRGIVEMHGGTVQAHSTGPGQGSEFSVTLPLMLHGDPQAADTAGAEPAPPALGWRVVVIEDNVDMNESLKVLLQLMGCEVSSAFDGAAGAALVQAERPQIVFCDIGLPKMDGYAVIAQLRQEMKAPLPVMIALTGYGQAEDRARALTAGFDHHLVKPVDADALLTLLAGQGERIGITPR